MRFRLALTIALTIIIGFPPAADAAVAGVHVMAAGDISCYGQAPTANACQAAAVAKLVTSDAFVFALGDLQYDDGSLARFRRYYDASWGKFKSRTFPIPGNHEYKSSRTAAGYFAYFGSRAPAPYYSFDLGAWHVVALNTSRDCSIISCAAGSAQEQWLRRDLSSTTMRCVAAMWHEPRFSSGAEHGDNRETTALYKALQDHRVDFVLGGHDHDYERFGPMTSTGAISQTSGVRQFVVGTGGRSKNAVRGKTSTQFKYQGFGLLDLSLGSTSYSWSFITTSGQRLDAGTASCR